MYVHMGRTFAQRNSNCEPSSLSEINGGPKTINKPTTKKVPINEHSAEALIVICLKSEVAIFWRNGQGSLA